MFYLYLLITAVIGIAGGLIGEKLRWPSGAMTGSMVLVMIANIVTGKMVFSDDMRMIMMVMSGFSIGAGISRNDIREIPNLILPIIIVVVSMTMYCLGIGSLIDKVSGIGMSTSLFATVPGGVSDMAAISEALDANTAYVSILQIWRLMNIYLIIPPLFRKATGTGAKDSANLNGREKANKNYSWVLIVLCILCACLGAFAFSFIGMSSGLIIGAMLGSASFGTLYKKVEYPDWMKFMIKVLSGMYLGSRIDLEVIKTLGRLIIPALIMLVGMVAFILVVAWLLSKLTKLSYPSGLIASTPGGVQEMFFLAEDIGAKSSQTAVIQTARLVCVYLLFPSIIELFVKAFG